MSPARGARLVLAAYTGLILLATGLLLLPAASQPDAPDVSWSTALLTATSAATSGP